MKLYDSDIAKELTVLSFLLKQEQAVPIKMISEELYLTTASVTKYLDGIQQSIIELNLAEMALEETTEGILYHVNSLNDYYALRNHLVHSSINIKLAIRLLLGNAIQREQLIMQYFISEATLKRRMKVLKNIFLKNKINLVSKNGVFSLQGEEMQIRKLAYDVLHDLYRAETWPFEEISETFVTDQINNYLGMTETCETKNLFRKAKIDFGIMISRLRNQQSIQTELPILPSNLTDIMTKLIPQKSEIPTNQAILFMMTLLSNEKYYSTPNGQNVLLLLQQTNFSIQKLVNHSIEKFYQYFDLDRSYQIKETTIYLYSIYFGKLFYPNWTGSLNIKKIVLPYPILNRKIVHFVLSLMREFPTIVLVPIQQLVTQYIVLFGRYRPLSFYELPIYIHINDDNLPTQTELLENMCKQVYAYRYNVVFCDYEQADVIIYATEATPSRRISKQQDGSKRICYSNLSDPFKNADYYNQIFATISNEKIVQHNEEVVRNFYNNSEKQ